MRLTIDNLGEAADLERGIWPGDKPLGHHPSVTRVLPQLLDELDIQGLSATFFIEGINCKLYPDAVREIAARGHEVGMHGWRHETWGKLSADREHELGVRADTAFRELGLAPRGFRPPGGTGTPRTPALLREMGYEWWSPVAGDARGVTGVRDVPFQWELVDAYHLMESFGEMRREHGDPAEPMAPRELGDRLIEQVAGAAVSEMLILHPFLMLDEAWWMQVRRLLAELGRRAPVQ